MIWDFICYLPVTVARLPTGVSLLEIMQPRRIVWCGSCERDVRAVADAAHPLLIADNGTIGVALEGLSSLSCVLLGLLCRFSLPALCLTYMYLYANRDNESLYCFQRICPSVGVCISTNQKVILKILSFRVNHRISGCDRHLPNKQTNKHIFWHVFVYLFCWVSKISLTRYRWNRWRCRDVTSRLVWSNNRRLHASSLSSFRCFQRRIKTWWGCSLGAAAWQGSSHQQRITLCSCLTTMFSGCMYRVVQKRGHFLTFASLNA